MAQVVSTRGNLSLYVINKWKDTNIGNCVTPVLAFVSEYPITTLFIGLCVALSALPLVLFISFITYSIVLTVFGFAMVEGTLFLISFTLLCGVLFFVVCVAICATGLLVLTWCSAAAGHSLLQKLQGIVPHFLLSSVTAKAKPSSKDSRTKFE